jgi:hypothetical protein
VQCNHVVYVSYFFKNFMAYCIGKCKEFRALKPTGIGRYAVGQKRCNYCEIFITIDSILCPCCNSQLRCLPRSRKGKELYNVQIRR